jgi:hypothetical protein
VNVGLAFACRRAGRLGGRCIVNKHLSIWPLMIVMTPRWFVFNVFGAESLVKLEYIFSLLSTKQSPIVFLAKPLPYNLMLSNGTLWSPYPLLVFPSPSLTCRVRLCHHPLLVHLSSWLHTLLLSLHCLPPTTISSLGAVILELPILPQ